ncbi:hypothetical protein C8Q77DRAFT_1224547 [Trametes polyzona]|nr:hypothetical protein C8Q77DRAFT_1224547 [Trametes polyzona]
MARRPSSGSLGLLNSPESSRQNGILTASPTSRGASHAGETKRPAARSVSSSQKVNSSINLNDIDPDELFEKYTVSEIRMVQHHLRAEADAKQEELRLMVGERYRDLLQASTSILALAKSSSNVLEALEEMRETVNSIDPSRAPKRATTGEDKHLQALQSLSAHVKLLLDAPEHLWRLMERKAYLNAAWLFLLARVVHRALSQDDDDQIWHAYGIDVAEQLPLVQRQWDTITPFRSQISHRATLFLREASSTPGEVCATLLTLHLLESRPIPETLSIYLAQRTKTLSSLLTRNASTSVNGNAADSKPNGKSPHRPRKVVVREVKRSTEIVLEVVSRTLGTARLMFADAAPGGSSMMKEALRFFQAPTETPTELPPELQLSTQILLSSLPSSSHLLLLPQNIKAYKPYVDNASLAAPNLQTQLREKLQTWFKKALQDLRDALIDWFAPLTSVREIWDVRSTLLQWLLSAEDLEPSERQELQSVIDAASLSQATSVWKAALGRLESSFREAISAATTALTEDPNKHPFDTQPVSHLFQAPPIPSALQGGAHGATAAAAHFAKYKSALRQQLSGRTPLVESALTTLEGRSREIQEDIAATQLPPDSKGDQITSLYRADAEVVCDNICAILEATVSQDDIPLRLPVYVGRICQELVSSSDFFERIGCAEAVAHASRDRLVELFNRAMQHWRERVVAKIVKGGPESASRHSGLRLPTKGDYLLPTRPSSVLTEALLSLSSEVQQLGVCLDNARRQQQIRLALEQFVVTYLDAEGVLSPSYAEGLQALWDASFLRRLSQLWEGTARDVLDRIDAYIARQREGADDAFPPHSDIDASTQAYITKTQVLLAPLLPALPAPDLQPANKTEKTSSLLLFGIPGAEQGFEPALELVKPPPRFGLLLVGGAALR